MKIFKYIVSLIIGKSIRYIDYIYQYSRDFLIKKDFTGIIKIEEHNTYYQASRYYEVKKIFQDLDLDGKTILDVGSGKGLILYLATKFKFKYIYGVEISKNIFDISINNLKDKNNIKIFNKSFFDLEDKIFQEIDIYFLFNPFPEIKLLIDKIMKLKNNKEILIIYINPVYGELFIENGFNEIGEYKFLVSTSPAKLYKHHIKGKQNEQNTTPKT